MGNDPDYEATQRERRQRHLARRAEQRAEPTTCINCGKARCDGHDGDSWRRCAERYRAWAIQADQRASAELRRHGIDPSLLAMRTPGTEGGEG